MTAFEQLLLSVMKSEMVAYLKAHPEEFTSAVALGLSSRKPHAWRAVWALEEVIEPNDPRLSSFLPQIMAFLPRQQTAIAACGSWCCTKLKCPSNTKQPYLIFACSFGAIRTSKRRCATMLCKRWNVWQRLTRSCSKK